MGKHPNDLEQVERVIKSLDRRNGHDIVALDMKGLSILADYQVIVSGTSSRQTNALARGIVQDAAEHGVEADIEGKLGAHWQLVDLGNVIVHVFNPEDRERYNLEGFWSDAEMLDLSEWIAD